RPRPFGRGAGAVRHARVGRVEGVLRGPDQRHLAAGATRIARRRCRDALGRCRVLPRRPAARSLRAVPRPAISLCAGACRQAQRRDRNAGEPRGSRRAGQAVRARSVGRLRGAGGARSGGACARRARRGRAPARPGDAASAADRWQHRPARAVRRDPSRCADPLRLERRSAQDPAGRRARAPDGAVDQACAGRSLPQARPRRAGDDRRLPGRAACPATQDRRMKHDLTQMTAHALGKLYAKGKASPVETMKVVLARTDKVNPTINALCVVDAEPALAAARASERRWKKGKPLSPIDGVPVSIKELVRVKGWPASMGSKLTDKTPVDADAPAVARLREAGAIVFAQSTSSEFGHKGVTDTPLHGVTRNPWNTAMTPGGSSGGAGAAVAAGLGPLAIGTDGGGSVRSPSSCNGLVGIKTTYGRVPTWPPTLNGDFSNTGPMCRTAQDCALMLNAITRSDVRDPTQLPADDTDYLKALKHKPKKPKVAFLLRMSEHPIDIEVASMVTKAAKQVEKLGCAV